MIMEKIPKRVRNDIIPSPRDTSRTNELGELSETACRMAEGWGRVCHVCRSALPSRQQNQH